MKHPSPTHGPLNFLCMSCGEDTSYLVDDMEKAAQKPRTCKACGQEARALNFAGLFPFMRALVKQNQRLRRDIFELECAIERLANPKENFD